MHVFFSLLEENRWGEREYCTNGVTPDGSIGKGL